MEYNAENPALFVFYILHIIQSLNGSQKVELYVSELVFWYIYLRSHIFMILADFFHRMFSFECDNASEPSKVFANSSSSITFTLLARFIS